jgi:hypothetical protein
MDRGDLKIGFTEGMVLTVVVVGILLFAVWRLAGTEVTPQARVLQEQVAFLSSDLDLMNEQLSRSRSRLVVLEQEAEVLRQANRLLRNDESDRQAEMGRLQSELEFYGKLAGTGGAISGLDLYRAEIIATESDRVYQFVLTLTQNIRRASIISGQARIDVEGTREDRPVTLNWLQLTDGETPEPDFRFKYFQQLEGYLTLPEDFRPTRLLVSLQASDRKQPVRRDFNWAELRND